MTQIAIEYYIDRAPPDYYNMNDANHLLDDLKFQCDVGQVNDFLRQLDTEKLNSLFHLLIKNEHIHYLKAALKSIHNKKLNINGLIIEGFYPLHFAVYKNSVNLLESLIDHGIALDCFNAFAIVNTEGFCAHKFTPLHLSVLLGNITITRKLLDSGADINLTYSVTHHSLGEFDAFPILNAPAYYGMYDIIKLLLEYGANPHHVNTRGYNSMHVAEANGHKEVLKLLISYAEEVF
jgi:ankyrin repeat protein